MSFRVQNGTLPYTTLRARITITGFCFKASVLSDYLSIALLLSHMFLALSHTTWLLGTGRSSSCWDSITELVALVQNSRPAPIVLKNTCAGIKRKHTFSIRARIRATAPITYETDERPNAEHVEVIFGPDHLINGPRTRSISSSSLQENTQDIELVTGEHDDAAKEPLMPIPRFPTTLTDSAFQDVYHTRRVRGRSSVSVAESQSSLLRADRLRDRTSDRRQSGASNVFLERVQVGKDYGQTSDAHIL